MIGEPIVIATEYKRIPDMVDLYPVNFRGGDVGLADIYMHRDDEGRAVAENP